MKYLVTGGAGLIGSSVVKRLTDQNHSVLVLDDFTYSYASTPCATIQRDISTRFECLLNKAQVQRCSTLEKLKLRSVITQYQPDRVIHLAAIPLVAVATRHVEAAADSLSTGLINLLEILRDTPSVDRFVYASSSMIYGNFEMDPMPEDGPMNPLNIYGGLKLAGETLTKSYLYPTGIDHVIVRPSAVYGPTDQHRRVAQKFCENALDGLPVKVSQCNDHIMDFTYVDDIAQGFFLAATHDNAANETFNMTYGQARRLTDLVAVLRKSVPSLQTSTDQVDDHDRPQRGSLSIDKARRLLGYNPQYPLEKGIPIYLDHLRQLRMGLSGAA